MKGYKLTDKDGYTRQGKSGETLWVEGKCLTTSGEGDLCGPGWIHWYRNEWIAVLMNCRQGAYDLATAQMWEVETGDVVKHAYDHKSGATQLTTVRRVDMPTLSTEERVEIAIRYATLGVGDTIPTWTAWANGWLDGTDRSESAARSAAWSADRSADRSAWSAAWSAAWSDDWSAESAAWSAESAASPARYDTDRLIAIIREVVAKR